MDIRFNSFLEEIQRDYITPDKKGTFVIFCAERHTRGQLEVQFNDFMYDRVLEPKGIKGRLGAYAIGRVTVLFREPRPHYIRGMTFDKAYVEGVLKPEMLDEIQARTSIHE